MKELSLNILDIAENSVRAGATLVVLRLEETESLRVLTIADNGCGMSEDMVRRVTDPFCTTRTTRKVGMGLPLLQLEAEQTGGSLQITSRAASEFPQMHGTEVQAEFHTDHIDCIPLGDVVSTVLTLIQGHPEVDFRWEHRLPNGRAVSMDTRELREVLGPDVPLNTYEVLQWIRDYLGEQYAAE